LLRAWRGAYCFEGRLDVADTTQQMLPV
jgi:hypothetical protein